MPITLQKFSADEKPVVYKPSATGKLFHGSNASYRAIMGPVGSGKSSACVMELYTRAMEQKPFNGIRKVRYAIIRNTFPELLSTAMKTWLMWVPETMCPIAQGIMVLGDTKKITPRGLPLPDGTILDMEVLFLAQEREEDIRKLKSLELTMVWLNEVSEIEKVIVSKAFERCKRWPALKDGSPTFSGVIMDTNPPDEDSWYYEMAEKERPLDWQFFRQPPAILELPGKTPDAPTMYVPNTGQLRRSHGIAAAENIDNLNDGFGYYMGLIPGNSKEYIKVFLKGDYGSSLSGKPVFPNYNDMIHCAKAPLEAMRGTPLLLGWDFGLCPSCIIAQLTHNGKIRILDEVVGENVGLRQFVRDVAKPFVQTKYNGLEHLGWSDPAGTERSDSDEARCLDELNRAGFPTAMASTNLFPPRREAVDTYLRKMIMGEPGFVLSPTCTTLRQGLKGKYRYAQTRTSTGIKISARPEKNAWSHICDALQYICVSIEKTSVDVGMGNAEGPCIASRARPVVSDGAAQAWM